MFHNITVFQQIVVINISTHQQLIYDEANMNP